MRTVLAVPERHIERLIQVNLERQGYIVFAGGEAALAVRLIEEHGPDLVVLDPDLPGADLVRQAVGEGARLFEIGRDRFLGGPFNTGGPGMPLPPGVVPSVS